MNYSAMDDSLTSNLYIIALVGLLLTGGIIHQIILLRKFKKEENRRSKELEQAKSTYSQLNADVSDKSTYLLKFCSFAALAIEHKNESELLGIRPLSEADRELFLRYANAIIDALTDPMNHRFNPNKFGLSQDMTLSQAYDFTFSLLHPLNSNSA